MMGGFSVVSADFQAGRWRSRCGSLQGEQGSQRCERYLGTSKTTTNKDVLLNTGAWIGSYF